MKIEYNSNECFSAEDNPPQAKGAYAVKRKNDVVDEAYFDADKWSGVGEVASYSGVPALLSAEARTQLRTNIRAGLETSDGIPEWKVAQESAIKLARHFAVRMSRDGTNGGKLSCVKSMVAWFRIARTLGVSFVSDSPDASDQVDRALFAWGHVQIEVRARAWFVGPGSNTESVHGIRLWLDTRDAQR